MRQTARLAGVGLAVLYFCSAIRADTAQRGVSSPKRTETETERVDDDAEQLVTGPRMSHRDRV